MLRVTLLSLFFLMTFSCTAEVPANKELAESAEAKSAEVISEAPSQQDPMGQLVTIRGIISNPQETYISIELPNGPFSTNVTTYGSMVNPDGSFLMQFPIEGPRPGIVTHFGMDFPGFFEPGDDMVLNFSALNLPASVQWQGKGSVNNSLLQRFNLEFNSLRSAGKSATVSPQIFKETVTELREDKIAFVERGKAEGPTFALVNYIQARIDYEWGSELFDYPIAYGLANNVDHTRETPPNYYLFTDILKLDDANAALLDGYEGFISDLVTFKFRSSTGASAYDNDNYYADKYDYAKNMLTGETRFLALTTILMDGPNYGKVENIMPKYSDFIGMNPPDRYRKAVDAVYNVASKLSAGQPAPDFTIKDIDGRPFNLKQLKGKVVYIDFWATWCAPCIAEIPPSKRLKSMFSEAPVEFVYISVDEDEPTWRNYVIGRNLPGIHINIPGTLSDIGQMFDLSGVPKYMIIDKQGNIADSNAHRPSDDRIIDDLKEIMNR